MQIELAEVEASLALFAEGIAGRYYHIAATSEFAGRRVRLEPGASALTRDTLYLPERPNMRPKHLRSPRTTSQNSAATSAAKSCNAPGN